MICNTDDMDDTRAAEVTAESVAVLRQAGARFAYLFGSRAAGSYRPESDIDIAAYFGDQPPNSFEVLVPPGMRHRTAARDRPGPQVLDVSAETLCYCVWVFSGRPSR